MTALQRFFVVAALALFGVGAVVSPIGMTGSLFFFDAPGSLENPITVSTAMALWCDPVVCAYGAVSSIRRRRILSARARQGHAPG